MKTHHDFPPQLAIFFCAVLWSTAGLFIKLIEWNPLVIAGARSFLAAIFLIIFRAITERNKPNEQKKPLSPLVLWGGAACYAFTMLLFVTANKMTTSANVILLQYASPIWAALLGWLIIKEIPNWKQWVSVALVGCGMFIFFSNNPGSQVRSEGALIGDILGFVSGVGMAGTSVFMRKAKDHSPIDIVILANLMTAAVTIPFFIIYPPVFSSTNILIILFLGIIQIGVAAALFSYGIKKVTSVQALLISAIEPVLNPVWVLLVIGEVPAPTVIIGGAIIIAAVLFSSIPGRRNKNIF